MCQLHRRDFLLGLSGLLLYGCADSGEYADGKDYYPVAANVSGTILHWGKNNSIKVNTDSTNNVGQASYISAFKSGLSQWDDTLSELGISIQYVSSNADVNVKWVAGSTVSSGVLGYASSDKNITMTNTNNVTSENHTDSEVQFIAVHEFGHMLGIWSHSFDSNDIMYPFAVGPTTLSTRDKKTLSDFLYGLTPTYDMHDLSGPLVDPKTGKIHPHVYTYFTTNGCVIESGT